jgi:subtilisin family serine protease
MKYYKLALAGILMHLFSFGFSQTNNAILFKSGDYFPNKNSTSIVKSQTVLSNELVNDNYYRLIHFSEIPSEKIKTELKVYGIKLLQYIPKNTYYASIKNNASLDRLMTANILAIENVKPIFKLSPRLSKNEYPDWAMFDGKVGLNAVFYENISSELILKELNENEIEVELINEAQTVRIIVDLDKLEWLYSLPHFYYFEEIEAPEEPEGIVDRTNHRSNVIATDYTGGIKYDGTGITLMLQDNSKLDNHIDYAGRFTDVNATQTGDHGEHTGGIIGAAGNLDPKGRGMAFGAELLVYSPSNNNYNSVSGLYTNSDLTITSKSYGNGLNDGYTSLARQLDQQVRTMPSLVHVFSAGNSGSSWSTITGGHKQGKNVIAVGNVGSTDGLANSSSRGPAEDGRIKPDICAVGSNVYSTLDPNTYQSMTGTSMACPGVAGVLAQLYQAYKAMNGGVNPNSGLIKASILNTAEDLGNDGPDFKYGWGRINAHRAYNLLNDNNYFSASISQGGSNSHNINVPSGAKQLRVMVYWTDYEGSVSSSIALVNDINMQVEDPGSTSYNPWKLNPSSENSLAVRGIDNLNNMEQVTIDNPTTGNYTINIDGFSIPQGPQEYFVVYQVVVDEVVVTFPNGGEGFPPGLQTIRWDSNDDLITSSFLLEYTTNNGASWNQIVNNAPGVLRYYNWNMPNTVSGEVKIRVTQGAFSDESDAVFSFIGTPTNLNVVWACPDSLNLTWDAVSGATGYEVYLLGAKYMDSQGTTSNTNFTVTVPSNQTSWLSVRALGPTNAKGERPLAIEKAPGTFSCINSIESINDNSVIQLYPNPADHQLTIEGLASNEKVSIIVYNTIGDKVLEYVNIATQSQMQININDLNEGMYLLKIVSDNNSITKRFVKE